MDLGSVLHFTKDIDFFRYIWKKRPHKSEVSGTRLGRFSPAYFAHVLPKGPYPELRFFESNIVLMTVEEHMNYDHYTHIAALDDRFRWVFNQKDRLKKIYYQRFSK